MLARSAAVAVALVAGGAVAEDQYLWLRLDDHRVKWGSPTAGSGSEVTYAYVSAPVRSDDARNCRDMVPLDGLLSRWSVPPAALQREVEAAFALWQSVADISFRRVEAEADAQILIGAQAEPHGVAFADVATGPQASDGVRSIRRSLICLNPDKPWKIGFDGDPSVYDLRYAIAHEAGHAIGLDHPGPSGQLMSFRYDELFRDLQPGDVAGAVAIYGRRGAAVTATPLATEDGLSPAHPVPPATNALHPHATDRPSTVGSPVE